MPRAKKTKKNRPLTNKQRVKILMAEQDRLERFPSPETKVLLSITLTTEDKILLDKKMRRDAEAFDAYVAAELEKMSRKPNYG